MISRIISRIKKGILTSKCHNCGEEYVDKGWHKYCPVCDHRFMENCPVYSLMTTDEVSEKDTNPIQKNKNDGGRV